jgi:hypothetical protein
MGEQETTSRKPAKTYALIGVVVVIVATLLVIALRGQKSQSPSHAVSQLAATPTTPVPTIPAHSVLSLEPNPVSVQPGGQGSVSVMLNTEDNAVTAVQLELAYDPHVITNLQVSTGSLFQNSVVLINKNNDQTGRMTYAFGIQPSQPTVQGNGVAATITFTARKVGQSSQLKLLTTTLVTARDINSSVLKSGIGTTIVVQPVK